MNKSILIAATLTAGLLATTPVFAEVLAFKATLDGTSQSPKVDTKATGTADIKVDTDAKTITWATKSKDLTGPVTAAQFHGPATAVAHAAPARDIYQALEAGASATPERQVAD